MSWILLHVALTLVRVPGARRRLRSLLNNNCKIVSEAERDEQFRHHKHRAQEEVRWIVQKCRLTTFEYLMPDNLHSDADDNQYNRNYQNGGNAHMARDNCCSDKQENSSADECQAKGSIEHDPVDQHGQNHERRHIALKTKNCDGPQAQGKNRRQEQKYDADNVHGTVARIAMIFHVVRKLAPKTSTHSALATAFVWKRH